MNEKLDWTNFWKSIELAPKTGEPILAKCLPLGKDLTLTSGMTNQEFDDQFHTVMIRWNSYYSQWNLLYCPNELDVHYVMKNDITINPILWMSVPNSTWEQTAEISLQGLDDLDQCQSIEEVKTVVNEMRAQLTHLLLINKVGK